MAKKNVSKFTLVLRQLRENAGLTQRQVADALAMERSTYAYYEMGSTSPSGKIVLQLARVFNIDYRVLMDAIDDEEYDVSEDGNGFLTLNSGSWEERNNIYQLGKNEQSLILKYRVSSASKKEQVMKILASDDE